MAARNHSVALLFVPRDHLGLDLDLDACKVPTVASCKVQLQPLSKTMNLFSRPTNSWTGNKGTGESYHHFELATSDLDDDERVEHNRPAASLRIATKTRVPTSRVIMLSLALGGLQFFWSTIMANLPFLQSLGLSKPVVAASMISPPLSGTLVGPWVGAFSDGLQTKWGRRRPVMVLGAVSVSALLILLAWVDEWVHLLTCQPNQCGEYEQAVQHFVQGAAVTLVVGLSIAVQPFQSGARSIVIDNCPAGQQNEANVSSSRIICIGGIAGFLAGTIDIPSIFSNSHQITQLQGLAVINAVVVTSSVGATCLVFEESSQWCSRDGRGPRPTINIWRSVHRLPAVVRKVCMVQFFAWSAWYSLLYYTTTYIAELGKTAKSTNLRRLEPTLSPAAAVVTSNGGTHAVQSEATDGRVLRTGVFASLCFALLALSAAIVIPMILAWVEKTHLGRTGEGMEQQTSNHAVLARLWTGSQALCGILMLASVVVTSPAQGVLLVAMLGVPWAVTQWVPLAIVGCEVADARHEDMHAGTVLGIHNVAISAPQILAGLMATFVYAAADAAGSRVPTAWVLAFGGCAAVYASRLAVDLI